MRMKLTAPSISSASRSGGVAQDPIKMANVRGRKSRRRATVVHTRYGHKRKKFNKQPVPKIVQQQWDKKKTLKQNMSDLGLAYDANKVLPLPMAGPADKIHLPSLEDMTVEEAKKLPSVSSQKKKKWVEGFAEDAVEAAQGGGPARCYFSPRESQFLKSMVTKHGSNYAKMSQDKLNQYQLTPSQLKRKCEAFLSSALEDNPSNTP